MKQAQGLREFREACRTARGLFPFPRMKDVPTVEEVMAMLREEGIADLGADFAADGSLFEAGMDSMAVMQLIVIAEERFGAVIAPEDAGRENLETPGALARLIGRKMA
jgi:acyl carrier protein